MYTAVYPLTTGEPNGRRNTPRTRNPRLGHAPLHARTVTVQRPARTPSQSARCELGPVEDVDAGSILTGWVVVQEWMHPDGHKFLLRGWDHAIPSWTAKGMIHEVLYGDWPDDWPDAEE